MISKLSALDLNKLCWFHYIWAVKHGYFLLLMSSIEEITVTLIKSPRFILFRSHSSQDAYKTLHDHGRHDVKLDLLEIFVNITKSDIRYTQFKPTIKNIKIILISYEFLKQDTWSRSDNLNRIYFSSNNK